MANLTFSQYLKLSPFDQEFPLTESGSFSFHWSDWDRTCRFQKRLLLSDYRAGRLEGLSRFLDMLKERIVWLRYQDKLTRLSLYELYETYWDGNLRSFWFDNDKGALLSMHNESGPYMSLTSLKWMDPQLSQLFVLKKILTQSITMRQFRLRVNIPLLCHFDISPIWKSEMNLTQVSNNGILISFNGKHNLNKMMASEQLKMKGQLTPIIESSKEGYRDCFKNLDQADFDLESRGRLVEFKIPINFIKKYNNFEADRLRDTDNFFIFVKFEHIETSTSQADVGKALSDLTDMVQKNLDRTLLKESA